MNWSKIKIGFFQEKIKIKKFLTHWISRNLCRKARTFCIEIKEYSMAYQIIEKKNKKSLENSNS